MFDAPNFLFSLGIVESPDEGERQAFTDKVISNLPQGASYPFVLTGKGEISASNILPFHYSSEEVYLKALDDEKQNFFDRYALPLMELFIRIGARADYFDSFPIMLNLTSAQARILQESALVLSLEAKYVSRIENF